MVFAKKPVFIFVSKKTFPFNVMLFMILLVIVMDKIPKFATFVTIVFNVILIFLKVVYYESSHRTDFYYVSIELESPDSTNLKFSIFKFSIVAELQ